MKNTFLRLLLALFALTLFTGLAAAQSTTGSSRYAKAKKKTRAYLPPDLSEEVDPTQADDDEDEEELPPPPPKRTRPSSGGSLPGSSQMPYPYPRMQPARGCYTYYGACPMMVAIPQGSSCSCATHYGAVPGVAK